MEVVELNKKPDLRQKLNGIPLLNGYPVDLITSAKFELDFLKAVDAAGYCYGREFVAKAVYRYEKYWLPLVAAEAAASAVGVSNGGQSNGAAAAAPPHQESSVLSTDQLAPPLDVHWAWHVHMLAPFAYSKDCQRITGGKLVGHRLKSQSDLEQLRFKETSSFLFQDKICKTENGFYRAKTQPIWRKMYPDVPWDLTPTNAAAASKPNGIVKAETANGKAEKNGISNGATHKV